MKALFAGHGSPMNALTESRHARFLRDYAAGLPRPRALVVVSAHWRTSGSFVTGAARPAQIYDFYGFPDELYRLRYAPPGAPDIAELIAAAVPGVTVDGRRGIDHAGWALAVHMYPAADVPLLELSLDIGLDEAGHFELGRRLGALAAEGILFVGSGNAVHNLRDISFDADARPFPWAVEADAWIGGRLAAGDAESLVAYRERMPDWRRAAPTDEHYLPLLYVLGMAAPGSAFATVYEEIQNGSISMRCMEVETGLT